MDTRKIRPDDDPAPERRRFLGIRWTRKKIIGAIVAALVGLPALAWAAVYIFGLIYGTTNVAASSANITVESVVGTGLTGPGAGGVDCTSTQRHGGGTMVTNTNLDIVARAFLVTVNGTPPPADTDLGSCTVTIVVKNTTVTPNSGTTPASVSAIVPPGTLPVGWTVTPSAAQTISDGQSATLTVAIHAGGNAESGTFPGSLNVAIPPPGA